MMANGSQGGGEAVRLIEVGPGGCSGPTPWEDGAAVLVVADGVGSVLAGDVWLEVGPGDRVTIEPGASFAVKAGPIGPVVAVLVGRNPTASRAA
jgi:mannose-6-phosphate isomerase-like protein (cupin superfamily)